MLAELILLALIESLAISLLILWIRWNEFNLVFHKRYTFFNILFVAIYFTEQAVFITMAYLYTDHILLLVSFFALVVLSTVALQDVMMDSKIKKANEKLEEDNKKSAQNLSIIRTKYEEAINELRQELKHLEELLY